MPSPPAKLVKHKKVSQILSNRFLEMASPERNKSTTSCQATVLIKFLPNFTL